MSGADCSDISHCECVGALWGRITALEAALSDCVTHMKTAGSPEAVRACEAAERVLGVKR